MYNAHALWLDSFAQLLIHKSGCYESHRLCQRYVELRVGNETTNARGQHWWIEKPLPRIWPAATEVLAKWKDDAPHDDADQQQQRLRADLERTVFLDLETCGFAGSMIFLVGLLYHGPRGPVLVQLWARTYAEEPAVLESLREILSDQRMLATFNGKSFDWPQVRDRYTLHARSARHQLPELGYIGIADQPCCDGNETCADNHAC